MKAQPWKDLIIFGSGSIVSELTRHGLIDEYQFAVCPVLLGSGQSLVRGVSKLLPLDLLGAQDASVGRRHPSSCAIDAHVAVSH
jgi:dihydrofolate reductase